MDQAAILSPYGTMTASGSSSTGIPLDKTRVDPRVRPSRGCSIPARTNPNGRRPGSRIYHVRRGLATKASKPCKILVYLVVHPSLFHFITLKYARTLHKRRPCDARTNAPRTTQPQTSRLARSGVRTCTHTDASTCMLHPLNEKASKPPPDVGWHAGGGEGGGQEGGRRAQHRPPRACEGGKGGVR